jgi:hypothetical protein
MNLEEYCQGRPLEVGTENVLFIDDATVEDRWGVRRVINRPLKDPRNPVLMADAPWEDGVGAPNVIYDPEEGIFRMWYTAVDWDAWMHQFRFKDWRAEAHGYPYFMCYAESKDGVRWKKPRLEGHPYLKHDKTNVLVTGHQKAQASRVMWNPLSTERDERFLLTYKDNRPDAHGAFCLAYSDDGIEWQEDERNPVYVALQDTWQNMVYDPRRERWLLFDRPRTYAGVRGVPGGPTEGNYKRRVAVHIGQTPYDFGEPRVLLWPEEVDDHDFDHMVVSRRGNHFIGFIGQMGPPPKMEFNLHLAFSGDGLHWRQLPDRPVYLPHGNSGEFDCGSTSSAGGVVDRGRENFIYYRGSRHGQGQGNRNNVTGIGRAQFLRDRFAAQMGEHAGGFLLTREMVVGAPELVVNTTVADGYNTNPSAATVPAEFAVEIVRTEEYSTKRFREECHGGGPVPGYTHPQAVPGYTLEECTTRAVDLTEHVVRWEEKADLSELVGQPVFIRFYLKNCGIYSLRFREPA